MLSCNDVSKLVSESLDRKLPLHKRIAMGIHHRMCRFCLGFAHQIQLLHRAVREHPERLEPDANSSDAKLSQEARERIKSLLNTSDNGRSANAGEEFP
ncbi:MAG: hypothetical protein ACQESR_14995 [Planctomycetota bacterium]